MAFDALGRYEEALADHTTALSLQPSLAGAWANRGGTLKALGRLDEALSDMELACRLQPDVASHHYNQGLVLQALGRLEPARVSHARACALEPGHAEAHWNQGLCLLLQGRYHEGWPLHEWRWRKQGARLSETLQTPRPRWQGERVDRLLLWAEQGVGDEVFFASMLPEARSRVGHLTVTADARLLPLFRRSFPGIEVVDRSLPPEPQTYDAQLPIGSLPGLLRNTEDDFARVPRAYLKADAQQVQALRAWLARQPAAVAYPTSNGDAAEHVGPVIGLSWRSANPQTGERRSLSVSALVRAVLQTCPGARLLCLQYGDVQHELAALASDQGWQVLQCAEVDNFTQLDDFAALVAACDAVVSVQNSTVHLAGALGVPVWPLLMHVPDWRWPLGRSDSPWYPTAHPIQQSTPGDWDSVLNALRQRLTLVES